MREKGRGFFPLIALYFFSINCTLADYTGDKKYCFSGFCRMFDIKEKFFILPGNHFFTVQFFYFLIIVFRKIFFTLIDMMSDVFNNFLNINIIKKK